MTNTTAKPASDLEAEVVCLHRQLAEAKKDTERLDYAIEHLCIVKSLPACAGCRKVYDRAAIDAARKASK